MAPVRSSNSTETQGVLVAVGKHCGETGVGGMANEHKMVAICRATAVWA